VNGDLGAQSKQTMNLRLKIFILSALSFVLIVGLLYLMLRLFLLRSYVEVERQMVEGNLNQAINALENHLDQLDSTLTDWANWTDTYDFVLSGDEGYVEENLYADTFRILNLNWVVFLKLDGTVTFSKGIDLNSGAETAVPSPLTEAGEGSLVALVTSGTPVKGFAQLGSEVAFIAARPIHQNGGEGESAGTLLWARLIDRKELDDLTQLLNFPLHLHLPDDSERLTDTVMGEVNVVPKNDSTIHGDTLLPDVLGHPLLSVGITLPRSIYLAGLSSLDYFLLAISMLGLIFTILAILFQERLVLGRLMYLSEAVRTIGQSDNFNLRVQLKGSDELAELGQAINHFLSAVTQSRSELEQLNAQLEERVTERTQALEYQRAHLQAILDNMGDGVVYCVNDRIQFANQAMIQMVCCHAEDLDGKSVASLYDDSTRAQFDLEKIRNGTGVQRFEARLKRANKNPFDVSITLTPLTSPAGEIRRVLIFRDISKEKELEAQRTYFFGRASHELRNPLMNIMTRLYLLRKTPEQLEKHLDILDHLVELMSTLLKDLLDVTRLEQRRSTETWKTVNLQDIAAKVVEIQQAEAENKGIQLAQTTSTTPVRVFGDTLRLNQMLTNLVSNAIHYTPPGGQVWVEIGQTNGSARLVVRDTGQGIPGEQIGSLFQPFYRVIEDGTGTGLGLYIVKEISELHGGRVSVESTLGKGSTFIVTLPTHPA
jgi:PAS domain S-box-containing protein